jgi:hypothetical protein
MSKRRSNSSSSTTPANLHYSYSTAPGGMTAALATRDCVRIIHDVMVVTMHVIRTRHE